jgi:hypothetical protein
VISHINQSWWLPSFYRRHGEHTTINKHSVTGLLLKLEKLIIIGFSTATG